MYENSDLTLQELTKWKATNLLLNQTTHLHRNIHVSVITLVGHDISFSVSLASARDEPRALNTILPLNFISSLAMIPKTNKQNHKNNPDTVIYSHCLAQGILPASSLSASMLGLVERITQSALRGSIQFKRQSLTVIWNF